MRTSSRRGSANWTHSSPRRKHGQRNWTHSSPRCKHGQRNWTHGSPRRKHGQRNWRRNSLPRKHRQRNWRHSSLLRKHGRRNCSRQLRASDRRSTACRKRRLAWTNYAAGSAHIGPSTARAGPVRARSLARNASRRGSRDLGSTEKRSEMRDSVDSRDCGASRRGCSFPRIASW